MAAICASVASISAVKVAAVQKQTSFTGLARVSLNKTVSKTFESATVSNGVSTTAMLVWNPVNNKFFETFSFLPPLTDAEIAKQVDYIIKNGYTPCLEFADAANAYIASTSSIRFGGSANVNYFDNRYWTMYKLPLFGCTDPSQVLKEVQNAIKSFPDAYIRLVAFDNIRQVQSSSLLVHRPKTTDYQPVDKRSL